MTDEKETRQVGSTHNSVDHIIGQLVEESLPSHSKRCLLERLGQSACAGDASAILACVNCLADPDSTVKLKAMAVLQGLIPTYKQAFGTRYSVIHVHCLRLGAADQGTVADGS